MIGKLGRYAESHYIEQRSKFNEEGYSFELTMPSWMTAALLSVAIEKFIDHKGYDKSLYFKSEHDLIAAKFYI